MSIEDSYREASPCSQTSFEQACRVMPGGAKGAYFFKPYPLTMVRGEGCYLYDLDGRKYVDFANHHTVQILGHNHHTILQAAQAQMDRGIALGAPVGTETDLAEEMCHRVYSLDRIRFCNSGTEATLHAIRLARGFSHRPKIAKFEGGYHGSHDALEISTAPDPKKAGPEFEPTPVPAVGGMSPHAAEEVIILPYNDPDSVGRLISQHRDELACVIYDPKAGILPQQDGFAHYVREITKQNNVLFIFDEIVSFRFGTGGLQEHYDIVPDLTTYAKIIGGGFPIGAFGGKIEIMDLLDNSKGETGFFQSGSFSAHPIAMAAGLATLKHLTPNKFDYLNNLGDELTSGLNNQFKRNQIKAQAINTGSVFSIHFTDDPLTTYRSLTRSDRKKAHLIFLALLEQGYFLSHGLTMNALSLPMNTSHINGLIDAVKKAIDRVG